VLYKFGIKPFDLAEKQLLVMKEPPDRLNLLIPLNGQIGICKI
jgi:hypothetical protein